MTKEELKEQILLKRGIGLEILNKAVDVEKRALTEDEQKQYDEISEEIKKLQAELDELEKKKEEDDNKDNKTPKDNEEEGKDNKENRNNHIDMNNNKNVIQELINAGIEKRSMTAPLFEKRDAILTNDNNGSKAIFEDFLGIEGRMKGSTSVLGKMKHFSTVNNGAFITVGSAEAAFVKEGQKVNSTTSAFNKVTFKPFEVRAVCEYSTKFLANTDPSVTEAIKADLLDAIEEAVIKTILGDGDGKVGGSGEDKDEVIAPKGLLNGAGTKTTSITYADICEMEKTLDNANYSNYSYVMNGKVKSMLRQSSVSGGKSDVKMLLSEGSIDGTPAELSTYSKGLILADWNKIGFSTWKNAGSLTIDPFTKSDEGIIRIVASVICDCEPLRSNCFIGYKVG